MPTNTKSKSPIKFQTFAVVSAETGKKSRVHYSLDNQVCLERLLKVAAGDTGQSKIVADFLLAWWNAQECGGFNLTDLWGLDLELQRDCMQVLAFICQCREYPDALGYANYFDALILQWRPKLASVR